MNDSINESLEFFDRQHLTSLAFRITGSITEAEDVVQDAWLRWQTYDRKSVRNAKHFIARIVSNLSLDRLRIRQKDQQSYVGSWLPEPYVEKQFAAENTEPENATELADDISVAFMLALENLSEAERVVFILHDVFGYSFEEIAEILERESANCRQLASRARKALRTGKRRYVADIAKSKRLASAFQQAIRNGDISQLTGLLSENVTFISDGGGKVAAVSKPVLGAEKVAKMILGFAKTYRDMSGIRSHLVAINNLPGFVIRQNNTVIQTVALELNDHDLIDKIYVVRNPDKLQHLD